MLKQSLSECIGHPAVERPFSIMTPEQRNEAVIKRLDKQLLQADLRIEWLEAQLAEAQIRINKLTNEKVSNLKEHWNGGAS